jgi:hypothetical protein
VLLLVVGRILVPMVLLQEGAVGEQRLGVAVRCDGRHQLQAEVAFHHLVEAPIPNPQAAVAVHLGSSSSKQIQMSGQEEIGRGKMDLSAVWISPSPPSSWSPIPETPFSQILQVRRIQSSRAFFDQTLGPTKSSPKNRRIRIGPAQIEQDLRCKTQAQETEIFRWDLRGGACGFGDRLGQERKRQEQKKKQLWRIYI